MHIDKIKLNNFKNYHSLNLSFNSSINFLFGKNGSGKTNLMDAIYYLSFGRSAINSIDNDIIKHEKKFFTIEGKYSNNNIYKCTFKVPKDKSIYENEHKYNKIKEHIGKVPAVFITPNNISLIRNYSSDRRRFFDLLFSQIDRSYLDNIIQYNRLLKQRRTLFKSVYNFEKIDKYQLRAYDEKLIELNKIIYNFRKKEVTIFNDKFLYISKILADKKDKNSIKYISNFNKDIGIEDFEKNHKNDFFSLKTSIGIHNDDYLFNLNDLLIKKFGSQGQQKLFIIILKISEYYILKEKIKKSPILLLDDIFHKLDDKKIDVILDYISSNDFTQIFISDSIKERLNKIKKIKKDVKIIELDNKEINE